jgi:hypothetical protein
MNDRLPPFVPGLTLSKLYFLEAVKPILDAQFPQLRYDAARIGSGSEVLGFDTPRSMDHHWGCRVQLFIVDDEKAEYGAAVDLALRRGLPRSFRGFPTSMREIPGEPGVLEFDHSPGDEVNHQVLFCTLGDFLSDTLAWKPGQTLEVSDWLTFPQQRLRSLTAGGVWHSGLGDLQRIRAQFAWYPHDVWLYLLAAGWARIAQEDAFIGRTGEVNDETGSRIITARLVHDLMMLCYLMERVYAPYAKWFGTAFAQLKCAPEITPILDAALRANTWRERERHLATACEFAARMHNELGITEPVSTEVVPYFDRPFSVIRGDLIAETIIAAVRDSEVKRITKKTHIGSIDQFSNNTDLRDDLRLRSALKALYR